MFEKNKNKKKNNILISGLVFAVVLIFTITLLIFLAI